MKLFRMVMMLIVALTAGAVWASSLNDFEGKYTFVSRTFDGKADMEGWTGTMEIKGNMVSRHYKSTDGAQTKFYDGSVTQDGNVYVVTFTASHKPEYVGKVYRNFFALENAVFTMKGEDGKFVETWKKN